MSDIEQILERNKRVELDKAWEKSLTRRVFIVCVTYLFACLWLYSINESKLFLKAVVPVVGYLLSTLSLPWLKEIWIKNKK
jgi:preprotein translocase subunit SecF